MPDTESNIIPLDDWKARRAEQYAKALKELVKKLREARKLVNEMWLVADEPTDINITRALQSVIRGIELLIDC